MEIINGGKDENACVNDGATTSCVSDSATSSCDSGNVTTSCVREDVNGSLEHDFQTPCVDDSLYGDKDSTQSKSFCFTINNYTKEMEDKIVLFKCRCICYGHEVGKSGTPHLQGFIVFTTNRTKKQVVEMFHDKVNGVGRGHITRMRKPLAANIAYCSKEDKSGFIVVGDLPKVPSQKGAFGILGAVHGVKGASHGKDAPDIWGSIRDDVKSGFTFADVANKYPKQAICCERGIDRIIAELGPKYVYNLVDDFGSLYAFQQKIVDIIKGPVNRRLIYWFWDANGNVGKTLFLKHLCTNPEFKCQGFTNAKTQDLAHAWKGNNVIFNLSRSTEERFNYEVLEQLKDGFVFSSKYQSAAKICAHPHVIVFANWLPEVEKMSLDRWHIREIGVNYDFVESDQCVERVCTVAGVPYFDHGECV